MQIKLNLSYSNLRPFLIVLGIVRAPESESKVRFVISPSAKLVKVKLKTSFGPLPTCLSNKTTRLLKSEYNNKIFLKVIKTFKTIKICKL